MQHTKRNLFLSRSTEKRAMQRWASFTLTCLLFASLAAGCGSRDRYFAGQAKVTSSLTNNPNSNAWVAMSVRVSSDGTAQIKYGPLGGVIEGSGSFEDGNFSAQLPSDGTGNLTFKGQAKNEPGDGSEVVSGIVGTITRNPGESGEFAVAEIEEAKKFFEMY